jgi:Sulfotransferase domain
MKPRPDSLPDFLILGAPKAGTTAIYHALKQHPGVFMPKQKELRFFAFDGKKIEKGDPVNRKVVTDIDTYRGHFSDAEGSQIKGEASPGYLSSEEAPGRIRSTVPEARLIAILRNPVERAFSHFLFAVQQGYEPPDAKFLQALRDPYVDYRGFRRRRPYVIDGLYGRSLSRYLQLFGREQLHLIRYEELEASPQRVLHELYLFLELDTAGTESGESAELTQGYAASGMPRNALLHTVLKSRPVSRSLKLMFGASKGEGHRAALVGKNLYKPALTEDEWMQARELFQADIEVLEDLICWDCGAWKSYAG